jgi:hypothetical protein
LGVELPEAILSNVGSGISECVQEPKIDRTCCVVPVVGKENEIKLDKSYSRVWVGTKYSIKVFNSGLFVIEETNWRVAS